MYATPTDVYFMYMVVEKENLADFWQRPPIIKRQLQQIVHSILGFNLISGLVRWT